MIKTFLEINTFNTIFTLIFPNYSCEDLFSFLLFWRSVILKSNCRFTIPDHIISRREPQAANPDLKRKQNILTKMLTSNLVLFFVVIIISKCTLLYCVSLLTNPLFGGKTGLIYYRHKSGGVLLSAFPKTQQTNFPACSTQLPFKCRAPSREAVNTPHLKSFGMTRQGE